MTRSIFYHNNTRIMKTWFILITGLAILFMSPTSSAQQHPLFTQYMFNGLVINPAYTGSHESMTLTASLRSQWTGIKGSPKTEVFSAHTPILLSRSSAGLVATHDQLGVTNQTMVYASYAYRIPVSEKGKLALGAQAGMSFYKSNYSDLDVITSSGMTDDAFQSIEGRTLPNLGIGVYYHTSKTYVGLSLPTLINNKWNNQEPLLKARQQRHYFLSAGHVFDLSPDLKLKPNILLRWVEHGPFQYDVNANLLIKEMVWVGISYRMQDAVDGLVQWIVNDQLNVGYSYGYPTSRLSSVQSGTHEIVLSYRLKQNKHMVLSPRYF